MVKVVIVLILLTVAAVAALVVVMMWLVKSRYRNKKTVIAAIEAPTTAASKTGTCSRCGEQRIIVSESDGMCASCYSALRTKAP